MIALFSGCRWTARGGWLAWLAGMALPLGAQVTETPQTIQPGRFLVEMDAISLEIDRDASSYKKYSAVGFATTILSVGLTRSVDLQAGFQFFLHAKYEHQGGTDTNSGLGDMTFRTKWTFWRNDEIEAAAAVIPYVKIPSNTGGVGNGALEGGIIVPWAMKVAGIQTGAMVQWDMVRNDADNGYDSRWYGSAYAHRDFFKTLGFYGEVTVGLTSAGFSTFAGSLGGGATLRVSEHFMWDYGVSRGLGSRGTDWVQVLRFSWGF